jgi:aminopeptidase N
MRLDAQPPLIRLEDYRPPAYLLDEVALTFTLAPGATRVKARLSFAPNPARADEGPLDLRLDGRLLKLVSAAIDGAAIPENALTLDDEALTVAAAHVPDRAFVWEAETEIAPEENSALEGLYMSGGMYCTQCEAQGFRKITYYPDRPDVMARFRVRIEGDAPVLLSNGNLVGSGEGWAEWEDPFPKPCYLFALVAGDLRAVEDHFTTRSGREVLLQIWVRPGDEDRCAYAMDALKRSMAWDEEVYGREYDLDRFMIVAVDDFNMGAMENKGLNVFNSRYVLASPETATDADYKSIETIIAHEYFHNWTGNRITCRDWFQLCLKEGLTVFRDQQFSADQRSPAVKRIEDVIRLRGAQFREDGGPLAHSVRPEEYVEINNFYTATVYEKGAEVIGMLRRLVGPEIYRAALDLYFERHDGQACTIEDWIRVFEDASGRDLAQFKLWYSQAGTPRLAAEESWADGTYTLRLTQSVPPTPGQPEKQPMVIPVAYGLLGADGAELDAGLIELAAETRELTWDLPERPTASLLREFSAPVILERAIRAEDRAALLAHDRDTFNKWEAGRGAALETIAALAEDAAAATDPDHLAALVTVAEDRSLDPAFKALLLGLPSEEEVIGHIAGRGGVPDPSRVHLARHTLLRRIAEALDDRIGPLYAANAVSGPYTPDAAMAGRRALRARALEFLTVRDPEAKSARAQFESADNMTERMSALSLLVASGVGEEALARFHADWRDNRQVLDKWFAVQAAQTPPDAAAEVVTDLTRHPDFEWRNPNRFRSLLGTFAMANSAGFHRPDGAGYALFIDWMARLDPVNPQTTARLTATLGNWRQFDTRRQTLLRGELERLAALEGLSRDTGEIVSRLLRPAVN